MADRRRVEVGDTTWFVSNCMGCPMRRNVKCGMTGRIYPTTIPLPDWCPLEKMQGWE